MQLSPMEIQIIQTIRLTLQSQTALDTYGFERLQNCHHEELVILRDVTAIVGEELLDELLFFTMTVLLY